MTQSIFKKRALEQADIDLLKSGNVWKGEGPIGPDRLAHLTLTYVDFEGKMQTGEMMVMDVVADATLNIFKKLYELKFPIHKIALMSDFNGDDEKAMAANAGNAFVERNVVGSKMISLHAYGVAIDINQIQNPYLTFDGEPGQKMILHPKESSMGYLNRTPNRPGKSARPGMVEPIVPVFRQNGFTVWGGDWDDPLDYHHFQLPRALAEKLAACDFDTGKELFAKHVADYLKTSA